eukprot:165212_1
MVIFSPFIPFFFYFADKKSGIMVKALEKCCWFDICMDDWTVDDTRSKLRKFMLEKIAKHLGFILEALVEAFPQAILQMVAIVVFKEANPVAITSIMISLFSVATKSLVFSVACALNMKQLLLNWLSAVTDFFGIFVITSWCFYAPSEEAHSDELVEIFNIIRIVWLYKMYICIFPFVGCCSIVLHLIGWHEMYDSAVSNSDSICYKICCIIGIFFVVTILWIAGIICSILCLEILNITIFAGTLFLCGTTRMPETKIGSEYWFTLLSWVKHAKKVCFGQYGNINTKVVSISKQQDKIIRICSINNVLYSDTSDWAYYNDENAQGFLEQCCQENQYMNVSYLNLRQNTSNIKQSQFLHNFFHNWYGAPFFDQVSQYEYYKRMVAQHGGHYYRARQREYAFIVFGMGIVTWFFGPIYLFSRIITMLFPIFIVMICYANDIFIWSVFMINNDNMINIDMFQVIMITVYLFLFIILMVILVLNISEQFLMYHMLGSRSNLKNITNIMTAKKWIKNIRNHYYGVITVPIRRAIVLDVFGNDLGPIILMYLPADDHYEGIEEVVLAKTL